MARDPLIEDEMELMELRIKQSSGGVLQKRCLYKFCKIHKKAPALACVFNEAADLQSLNLSKKRFRHICFLVNSAKFLITPFLKDLRS